MITPVGCDFGNRRIKICIQAVDSNGKLEFHKDGKPKLLFASIPAIFAFDCPVVIKDGQEKKVDAFPLLFYVEAGKDVRLYLGNDTLVSQDTIGKIDAGKYTKSHIQRMLQGVLYQWSIQHKCDLSQLGKLDICVSMPPGSYQKPLERKKAEGAYRNAFNTGQSHMKIRPAQNKAIAIQIVTKFHSLVREAVVWGRDIPRRNELILVADLGGGTDDFALFNGSSEPVDVQTRKTGLITIYKRINSVNPNRAELKILRERNYFPEPLLAYFNQKELMIQGILRELPERMNKRLYLIGGGASLIDRNKVVKNTFLQLLPPKKVIIKDQYAGCRANWKEASK